MVDKEYRAKITSKNQLTLPAGVSALLHVGPGDELRFQVTEAGVSVRPVSLRERLSPVVGLYRKGRGKSAEQILRDVRELRGPRDE